MAEHRLVVGRDVAVDQPKLTVFDGGVTFGDVGLAGAQRLDLGAHEPNAAFQIVLDGIVEPCPPVLGDHLVVFIVRFLGHRGEICGRVAAVQMLRSVQMCCRTAGAALTP